MRVRAPARAQAAIAVVATLAIAPAQLELRLVSTRLVSTRRVFVLGLRDAVGRMVRDTVREMVGRFARDNAAPAGIMARNIGAVVALPSTTTCNAVGMSHASMRERVRACGMFVSVRPCVRVRARASRKAESAHVWRRAGATWWGHSTPAMTDVSHGRQ